MREEKKLGSKKKKKKRKKEKPVTNQGYQKDQKTKNTNLKIASTVYGRSGRKVSKKDKGIFKEIKTKANDGLTTSIGYMRRAKQIWIDQLRLKK